MNEADLIYRLRKRAEIRRSIPSRKSVQNDEPDRIADLLEEAADELQTRRERNVQLRFALQSAWPYIHGWCTINSVRNEIIRALFEGPNRE